MIFEPTPNDTGRVSLTHEEQKVLSETAERNGRRIIMAQRKEQQWER